MKILQYKELNMHKPISEPPIRNDKGQRDIKHQKNTKEDIFIYRLLMKISIFMVAGSTIPVNAWNFSLTKIFWIWVHIPIPSFTKNYNNVICYSIILGLKYLSMKITPTYIAWYKIMSNIYNYRHFYICTINNIIYIEFHRRNDVNLRYYCHANILYFMIKIFLRVKNVYTIEIAYMNENGVKSNIYK